MQRLKTSFLFSRFFLIICAISVIGLFFGVQFIESSTNGKFDQLNNFFKVYRLVKENYPDEIEDDVLIEAAIEGMLSTLDPHSVYINKEDYKETEEDMDGEFEGIGVQFSIIDKYITVISPIIDGPADKAGIESGDKIIEINGNSAYQITIPEVLKKLKGPKGTSVIITVQRGNQEFKRTLIRDKIPLNSIPSYFMIDNQVGYIKLTKFSRKTFSEFKNAFNSLENKGMEKLLLDLRDNPGGLLDQSIEILDMFISSNDTLLYTKGKIWGANTAYEATFNRKDKSQIPIITLINRGSASASEIIAGTLQDLDRGYVIGETSFGKGSVQQAFDLDNETAARITIAKFYTPSGRSIQRDYSSGDDKYYKDLAVIDRKLSDSLKNVLPKYKTKKGRIVYGGGGIHPDIFSQDTTSLSKATVDLIYNPDRIIFNYTESIKTDYKNINEYYMLKQKAENSIEFDNFIKWLIIKEDHYNEEGLEKDWKYIKTRIIAELANKTFSRKEFYRTMIMNDKTVLESLKYFDEAKKLLN